MQRKKARVDFSSLVKETREQSKYELYGDRFLKLLQQAKEEKDTRIHPHQLEAVLKTYGMFMKDGGMRILGGEDKIIEPVLIVSPTGSGKSGMIVLLPYILKAKKCLILTSSKNISDQLGKAFGKEVEDKDFFQVSGILTEQREINLVKEPVRMIQKGKDIKDHLTNLVIVNAQRFGGRSDTSLSLIYNKEEVVKDVKRFFAQFDLLIVDEAHHYPAKTWQRIVHTFSQPVHGLAKKIVFLTATPYRKGKKNQQIPILPNLDQRIAYSIRREDLEGKYIRAAKFKEMQDVEQVPWNVWDILEEQERKEGRFKPQAMIMVGMRREASYYEQVINSSLGGNYAVAIYGGLKNLDKLINDFNDGVYRIAIVCGLLSEGYDNPKVTLCVILRNICSQIWFTQFVGRCLRMNNSVKGDENDKTKAIILSYKKFKQRKMWDMRDRLAVKDPVEEDEEEEVESEADSTSDEDGPSYEDKRNGASLKVRTVRGPVQDDDSDLSGVSWEDGAFL